MAHAEALIRADQIDVLMEQIIARAADCASNTETLIVEGLVPTRNHPFADDVNYAIAKAMDADVIFIATPGSDTATGLMNRLEIAYNSWGGKRTNA